METNLKCNVKGDPRVCNNCNYT